MFKIQLPIAKCHYKDKDGNLYAIAQLVKWIEPNVEFTGNMFEDELIKDFHLTKGVSSDYDQSGY